VIVLDVGLPKKVMEYYEDYVKLGEISQEYVEKVRGLNEKELRMKETSMRLDENEVRINETEGDI
jgi:hypothetical protein